MIGQKLSHYEVLEALGAGGMGEVYRARDTKLGRDVAIKVLPRDRAFNDNARLRFQREAMAASALNHPNIITIHEINSHDNIDFIVMELVRGMSLANLMVNSRLPVPQALRYCVQIADAVAKAHSAGIIHRDLKPGNVMITSDGLVKVLDFGLAKFSGVGAEAGETMDAAALPAMNLTIAGATTGTLAYMSPEQARGEVADFRSDIFSFGIVIFQMLSGELPFGGTNTMARLHSLHFNPPRDLNGLCPEAPNALVALIAKMLEKEPAKRIQTMQQVAAELRGIARTEQWSLSQDSATVADFVPPPLPHTKGSQRYLYWLAAALALLAVSIAGGRLLLKHRAATQPTVADDPPPVVDDNAYSLYKHARDYLDHYERPGNVDKAIALLERALRIDPRSATSYAGLSEAYFRKNRENPDPQWLKLSADYAQRAVAADNDLALGHIALGIVEMQSGHSSESEKQFRMAASQDPKSEAPHRWLGWLYDKQENNKQAEKELQRALALDPNNWQTHMELGLNAYLSANYKQAASYWEQALKLEPDNAAALENLGGVYHMLGQDDDAASSLQRALEIKPSADGYNNLGTIRFYQGKYQDAVAAFEKTVALGANNYDNWASLADAYRWTPGNGEEAKQAYRRAIELIQSEINKNPKDLDMKATLATYLAKTGQKELALQALQSVERAAKKEPQTWYKAAIAYELCGHREQALEALSAAIKGGQSLGNIQNEPELVSLRADPAYHLRILNGAHTAAAR